MVTSLKVCIPYLYHKVLTRNLERILILQVFLLVETFLETQVIGGYNDRQTVCWH